MLQFGLPVQVEDIKSTDDGWTVSGYGSTFNNVDLGNDVMMPGAFKRTLSSGSKVRFLHSHDPRMVLGVSKNLREDKRGLFGDFKISRTKLGEETRQLLKDGALDSFSIGYIAKSFEWADNGDVRQLKDVELLEVSLVSMPMNPEAVVTSVKSYLAALGIDLDEDEEAQEEQAKKTPTFVERARFLHGEVSDFVGKTRVLVDSIDHSLSQTKRQELEQLLEQCLRLDAVRSELETVLSTAPTASRTDAKRVKFELDERKRRLAHILKEN